MENRLGDYRLALNAFVLCWIALGILLFFYKKGPMELWLNQYHTPSLDLFFKYITYLGDGVIYAILAVFLLFRNFYHFALIVSIAVVQTIPVQVMKRLIFNDIYRPSVYFDTLDIPIYLVEGVRVCSSYSFPSGHTASAFSIAIFVTYVFAKDKKYLWLLSLGLALITALSRVYLMQHFFIDIYVGAILGILCSVFCIYWFEVIRERTHNKLSLWNWKIDISHIFFFQKK